MEDPKNRLVTSISTQEMQRRWKATREWMGEEGVDYLLLRNDEEFFGHLKSDEKAWLIDILHDMVRRHGWKELPVG